MVTDVTKKVRTSWGARGIGPGLKPKFLSTLFPGLKGRDFHPFFAAPPFVRRHEVGAKKARASTRIRTIVFARKLINS